MPVTIHGKEYHTVAERLDMMNKKTKGNYSINTELLKFEGGCVIIKATLTIGEHIYTGIAMEEAGSSKINETSFVECAETSAIGRSLASASYHGSEFCSADELVTALGQQKSKPAPKQTMKADSDMKATVEAVKEKFGGTEIKNLVNFGKHNGKDWSEVPEDYINWVCKNSKVDWQRDEAQNELDRRSGNVPDRPNRASGGMSEVALEEVDEFEGMPS